MPCRETEAEIIFTPTVEAPKLGGADLGAPGHAVKEPEEEGMIMGPSHPIFQGGRPPLPSGSELPVPPGARFDPISPVGPGFYSPGDPDFDDLPPPGGPPLDPLGKGIHPPRGPKLPGSKPFPSAPFGRTHGAPPGPGNPPFFM